MLKKPSAKRSAPAEPVIDFLILELELVVAGSGKDEAILELHDLRKKRQREGEEQDNA